MFQSFSHFSFKLWLIDTADFSHNYCANTIKCIFFAMTKWHSSTVNIKNSLPMILSEFVWGFRGENILCVMILNVCWLLKTLHVNLYVNFSRNTISAKKRFLYLNSERLDIDVYGSLLISKNRSKRDLIWFIRDEQKWNFDGVDDCDNCPSAASSWNQLCDGIFVFHSRGNLLCFGETFQKKSSHSWKVRDKWWVESCSNFVSEFRRCLLQEFVPPETLTWF